MTARVGVTLVELLVTMSILGVLAAVTTMAARRLETPAPNDPAHIVADSLRGAVERGSSPTIGFMLDGRFAAATLNADGSVVADSALRADWLAGSISK